MKTACTLKSKCGLQLVTGQARAQMRHLRPWATPHTGASSESSEGRLLGVWEGRGGQTQAQGCRRWTVLVRPCPVHSRLHWQDPHVQDGLAARSLRKAGIATANWPLCFLLSVVFIMSLNSTSLVAQVVKRLPTIRETWIQSQVNSQTWVGKIPWRRKGKPTPLLLPGKSHGRRSVVGYSHGVTKSQTWLDWATSLSFFQL